MFFSQMLLVVWVACVIDRALDLSQFGFDFRIHELNVGVQRAKNQEVHIAIELPHFLVEEIEISNAVGRHGSENTPRNGDGASEPSRGGLVAPSRTLVLAAAGLHDAFFEDVERHVCLLFGDDERRADAQAIGAALQ
jgi:hypothetical protein